MNAIQSISKLPQEIFGQHTAILGKTGSGKTSTGKLLIEHVVAHDSRVCVLDPIKSDWWGMVSSADGKRGGLPFQILGGPRGHVPLHASAGKAIAEVVANGSLPLSIVDMADFQPGGQAHFFVDFAPTLLKKMRGVLYLVIEEAHLFAPKERSGVGAENMSIHWAKTLATAGRSKGIRLVVLTQRTQALHNAVLGSCETMIVHRQTAPADQEPVKKWLAANTTKDIRAKVESTLAALKTGTAWVCSGEANYFEQVAFPRIKTYDNTATPTGKGGEQRITTAPVDTAKLAAIVQDAIDEAKANDPAELKKKIRQLEAELKKKPAATVDTGAIERAAASAVAERDRFWKGELHKAEQAHGSLAGRLTKIHQLSAMNGDATIATQAPPAVKPPVKPSPELTNALNHIMNRPTASRPAAASGPSGDSADIPKGEAAILAALIQFPDGLDRSQLTVLTGYKRSSRDAYLGRLQQRGYVEASGGRAVATTDGQAALPDAEPLPTGIALQEFWQARLPAGEWAILQQLIENHPNAVPRDALTEATGYKRSSRDAYIGRLKAKQLVADHGAGVRATDNLF